MNQKEYFDFAEKFYSSALEMSKKKNNDYTRGSVENPFANFESVETFGISTEVGFLTRMGDKMMRISSYVNSGKLIVEDESVTDTLQDLANYCCLFAGWIKSQEDEDVERVPSGFEKVPQFDKIF